MADHSSSISLNPINLMKITVCARPDCDNMGTKDCSACLNESYCSKVCQEEDWKDHKIMCHLIKLMIDVPLPFIDVYLVVQKVLKKAEAQKAKLGRKRCVKLLEHAATFAEQQYGKRITGNRVDENNTGDHVDNWQVEINSLLEISTHLGQFILFCDDGDESEDSWKFAIFYLQKSLALLNPWMLQINLTETERIDVLTEEMIELSTTERYLSCNYMKLNDWENAQHHMQQYILFAKKLKEGKTKIESVCNALNGLSIIYSKIDKLDEAKALREEAYMYASEAYDPEHPLVLEAGGQLIEVLVLTEDFYDAERFSRIC